MMRKQPYLISITLTAIIGILVSTIWNKGHPAPKLEDGWWAEGNPRAMNESIRTFTINISDEVLLDLRQRLKNTRLPIPIEDSRFRYGFNSKYLEKVLAYWKDQYDWRERVERLNSLRQFKTNIEGLDVHFVQMKPARVNSRKTVIPLLMVHGWPGSIVEFVKIIPMLTTAREDSDFVFEVVAPSIPGFGFSAASCKPGLSYVEIGQIFDKLMARLGFQQYYIHGEDWGAFSAISMATIYPDRIKGLHTTMAYPQTTKSYLGLLLGSLWPTLVTPREHVHMFYPLLEKLSFLVEEFGYFALQTTKPDTIGIALSDSPAGLAAYILEKFSTWTNKGYVDDEEGGLEKSFNMTELLDNVMIYWVTNTITSSMRIYKESSSEKTRSYKIDSVPCVVPTAISVFPNDLFKLPGSLLTSKFTNLISYEVMPRGGHFAAFEEPRLTAEQIWKFVAKIENQN